MGLEDVVGPVTRSPHHLDPHAVRHPRSHPLSDGGAPAARWSRMRTEGCVGVPPLGRYRKRRDAPRRTGWYTDAIRRGRCCHAQGADADVLCVRAGPWPDGERGSGLRPPRPGRPCRRPRRSRSTSSSSATTRPTSTSTRSSALPTSYRPVVRSRFFYGIDDPLGIECSYDYDVTFTDGNYEDDFFQELMELAEPKPLTLFQSLYNQQRNNVLDVADDHWISTRRAWSGGSSTTPRPASTRRSTRRSS